MTAVTDFGAGIITSVTTLLANLLGFIPRIIGALIIIWIGWIIANFVYRIVTALLRRLHVDDVAQRTGITAFLARGNVQTDAAGLIGGLAKWFIRLIFLEAAFNALGMPQVVAIINTIILFLPNLLVALILLFIGTLIARFVRDIVKASSQGAGMSGAQTIANICYFGVMAFFVIAAIGQIGVATGYLNILFTSAIGGLSLALALAFGLGGRDAAARAIDNVTSALTAPSGTAAPLPGSVAPPAVSSRPQGGD